MTYFCFLLLCVRGGSSDGFLNMSLNMGTYFLKMTAVTVKFLSSFSVLCRNSFGTLAISCHFFILLKNSIKLGGDHRIIIQMCIPIYTNLDHVKSYPSFHHAFFFPGTLKSVALPWWKPLLYFLRHQTQTVYYHTDDENYKWLIIQKLAQFCKIIWDVELSDKQQFELLKSILKMEKSDETLVYRMHIWYDDDVYVAYM